MITNNRNKCNHIGEETRPGSGVFRCMKCERTFLVCGHEILDRTESIDKDGWRDSETHCLLCGRTVAMASASPGYCEEEKW